MPHTPGPWNCDDRQYSPLEGFAVTSDAPGYFDTICRAYSKRDAVLIAAAPDLLEALKDCYPFIYANTHPGAPDVAKRVTKAIAKAEGRNA